MLSGVDWLGVFKTVKDAIWDAIAGAWDGLMSEGKNYFIGTIGKITSWFEESFWGPIAKGIFGMAGMNILLGAARGFFQDGGGSILGELGKSAEWFIGSLGGLMPSWGNALIKKADLAIVAPIKDFISTSLPIYLLI